MPTERMEEVEVVCGMCQGEGTTEGYPGYAPQGGPDGARYECFVCLAGTKTITANAKPGSLTAARLRLADAAEAWLAARLEDPSVPIERAVTDATAARIAMSVAGLALAALRTARGEG